MQRSDDDAPRQDEPEADGKATPNEWRGAMFPVSERGVPHHDSWQHGAAAALHGWDLHRHHTGTEMRLSRQDYESALKAATTMVAVDDKPGAFIYQPHEAALSEVLKKPAPAQPQEEENA